MRKTLLEASELTNCLSKPAKEKYRKTICELLSVKPEEIPPDIDTELLPNLPTMEQNDSFINASSSVGFRYTRRKGLNVFAKKDIKRGDVLFIEKPFAFAPVRTFSNIDQPHDFGNTDVVLVHVQKYCQYCLALLKSYIPCKTCVKHLYCNEECRDLAWAEFHRWECYAVRSDMIHVNNHGYLSLRIIFKALSMGFSSSNINFDDLKEYGSKNNNYNFVYNMYRNWNELKECWLKLYAATAAFWVHYLKKKTDFFKCVKELPSFISKSEKELMSYVGGLIIRHCIQLHTNTIPLRIIDECQLKNVMIAITVCPSATLMRHSCLPNTSHYFLNDIMVVKATEDIKENEEIFRSYTSVVSTAAGIELAHAHEVGRKTMLKDLCFVNCKCRACINPRLTMGALNAYLCVRCRGAWACMEETKDRAELLLKEHKCLDCNYKSLLPQELIEKEDFLINLVIEFSRSNNIKDANICRNIGDSIYVRTHPFYATYYSGLNDYYLLKGDMKEYLESGKQLIALCKQRRTSIVVDTAIMTYTYCLNALEYLKKHAVQTKLQDLGHCLNILTDFLNEVTDVLNFYYPQLLDTLEPHLNSVQELRILHTLRIANSKGISTMV
ncbi:hypothetical protein ILUMI_22179 [Ignelater luminosus]|uniref:SET and MYND domain-containing protein 4 n=1 Tax=Ignelater luminosus TaxID=2038154 RepID=A0A8K0G2U6_IGNLU|nr:hypothetical protein ILUMI_22179 [Ignelater luminosus]